MEGSVAPVDWQGGLNLTYYLGPTLASNQTVQLEVHTTKRVATVKDVVAKIEGFEEPGRKNYFSIRTQLGPIIDRFFIYFQP